MLNPLQQEIVSVLIDNSLYFKRSGMPSSQLEQYAEKESFITDSKLFLKKLTALLGDDHSFLALTASTHSRDDSDVLSIAATISAGTARVTVPGVFGSKDLYSAYAAKLSTTIDTLVLQKPSSWVIDVAENWGGSLGPMLAALYSFFDKEATIGAFKYPDGRQEKWRFKAGHLYFGDQAIFPLGKRIHDVTKELLVVHLGSKTSSSGEAVAIAFKSRPLTSFEGEKTAGFTTGNKDFLLSDGSILYLAVCEMIDVWGHTYPEGIAPDVK